MFQSIFEYFGDEETTENHVVSLYPSSLASSSVKIKIYIYIGISKKYLLSEISKISDQP